MKQITIYKCPSCLYSLKETDGQIPLNFMFTCPICKRRMKKYVLGL